VLFPRLFIIIFSLIAIVTARDFSRFSLQGAFYPLKYYDINRGLNSYSSIPSLYTPMDIGVRVMTSQKVGIDFMMGGFYNSGFDKDSSNNTIEYPRSYSLSGKIGIYYNIFQHKKASLGALVRTGGYYEKHVVANYNISEAKSYETFTPWGLIGIEPSLEMTKNLSFFTAFGIEFRMNPNSREYQFQNSFVNNTPVYKFVELSDANTDISLGGFCLGIRFQF
jgi:hypothetical protein